MNNLNTFGFNNEYTNAPGSDYYNLLPTSGNGGDNILFGTSEVYQQGTFSSESRLKGGSGADTFIIDLVGDTNQTTDFNDEKFNEFIDYLADLEKPSAVSLGLGFLSALGNLTGPIGTTLSAFTEIGLDVSEFQSRAEAAKGFSKFKDVDWISTNNYLREQVIIEDFQIGADTIVLPSFEDIDSNDKYSYRVVPHQNNDAAIEVIINGTKPEQIVYIKNNYTEVLNTGRLFADEIEKLLSNNTITAYAAEITGTNANRENIIGSYASDLIKGFGGKDEILGGFSDDIIYGGNGDDDIYGGTAAFRDPSNPRNLTSLGSKDPQDPTSFMVGGEFLINYENDGNDRLYGQSGRDRLYGETGDDILDGGADDDELTGGADGDELTGGAGSDTFIYSNLSDSLLPAESPSVFGPPNFDRITDFQIGTDRLDAPRAVAAADIDQLGNPNFGLLTSIGILSEASFQTFITEDNFEANTAATFSVEITEASADNFLNSSQTKTFLALNDGEAGFSLANDAIIEITGYSGDLGNLAIV